MAKFRVRARTVDMLGRQQISNIPTAIHELFKNAHDAYAERVEVDYYRHDDAFILRDDGFGMSLEDFERRWLTIGTESKLTNTGGELQPYHGKISPPKRRTILGEKGIGRLSIATIGPQVLVLTRAKFGRNRPLVVSFINWGMFELPGIDLNQIEIPVKSIASGQIPNNSVINKLIDSVRKNLESLKKEIPRDMYLRINNELNQFNLDPKEIDEIQQEPSLASGKHGTHFYIQPADKIIQDDIHTKEDKYTEPPLLKILLGFSNTMSGVLKKPPLEAQFRDHHEDATTYELIGRDNFFTPDEFKLTDHHFKGRFDSYGKFNGKVSIYGKTEKKYSLEWIDRNRKKTSCGPFNINIAYLQGQLSKSLVPPDMYRKLANKLNRIGGVYVYKNHIRILPYGDSDYDFLNIERRRTLGAGYYFFSYRRMFGTVEISSEKNPNLMEKSGREGFRENKAYREFKDILENFLQKIAGDFFREEGKYGHIYEKLKTDIEKREKIRQERAAQVKRAHNKLANELESFFIRINRGEHETDLAEIRLKYLRITEKYEELPRKELTEKVIHTEHRFRVAMRNIRESYEVTYPKGIGLNKTLRRDYTAYEAQYEKLEKDYFIPIEKELSEKISNLLTTIGTQTDTKKRYNAVLAKTSKEAKDSICEIVNNTKSELTKFQDIVENNLRSGIDRIDKLINNSLLEFRKLSGSKATHKKISELHIKLENKILNITKEEIQKVERLSYSLRNYFEAIVNNKYTPDELTEALEEKLEELTEEIDESAELLHIGMALGIIQHEFLNTIKQVRGGIQRLKPWAETNPELFNLYKEIQASFEHLAGYLKLFDPLSRRLNPTKIKITGEEVYIFLINMFSERIKKENISLNATEKFKSKSVIGFTSTFYPSFVNLVDNSIYWLSEYRDKNRSIILDTNRNGFTIKDNGPGVEERYKDRIFDFGFTRKTTGRGMGLYITREALRREDHELILLHNEEGKGVTFQIMLKSIIKE